MPLALSGGEYSLFAPAPQLSGPFETKASGNFDDLVQKKRPNPKARLCSTLGRGKAEAREQGAWAYRVDGFDAQKKFVQCRSEGPGLPPSWPGERDPLVVELDHAARRVMTHDECPRVVHQHLLRHAPEGR